MARLSRWLAGGLRFGLRLALGLMLLSLIAVLLLRYLNPPGSALMLYRWLDGQISGSPLTIQHQWRPWSQLSPQLALAVIAAEDQSFPDHFGFDLNAIWHSFQHNQHSRRLRGGSTLSQQLAKNLFLWPERSYLRKGLEAWFTLLIESCWSKQRILELYLNLVEFDRGVFGVEAASQHFFRRSSRGLSATESALLAAVLPNPFIYRVDRPSSKVRARQLWILRQMQQLGGTQLLQRLQD